MPDSKLRGTFFRLDLDRSLQLHPRLVVVISILSLVAAVAWFFVFHPTVSASAFTLNSLQVPGIILVSGVVVGFLAAILAYKFDRRVHSAYDVERILGFAPMVQLPDFDEVSTDIADEYLFSLAAGIELAAHEEGLTSAVFTGSASGTGVTTLIGRVHSMLQALGRPTVLIDASRTLPLEQDVKNNFVLTDTAPILFSAHAEYFARMAGCTIVVLESGVTTRIRLRAVARALQRINPYSVGFVLNRVPLAKADPAFRTAIRGLEKHLQSMGGAAAGQTLMSAIATSPSERPRREESSAPAAEVAPSPVPLEATQPQVQPPAEPDLKEPEQEEVPLLVAEAEVLEPVKGRPDIHSMVEEPAQPEAIEAEREEFRPHEAQADAPEPDETKPEETTKEEPPLHEATPEVLQLVEAMQEGFAVHHIQPAVLPVAAELEAQPPLEADLAEAHPLAQSEPLQEDVARQEAQPAEPQPEPVQAAHDLKAMEPEPELDPVAMAAFQEQAEALASLAAASPAEVTVSEGVATHQDVAEPARPSAVRRVRSAVAAVLEQFLSEAAHRGPATQSTNRPATQASLDLNGREPHDSNPAFLDREGALTSAIPRPEAGLRSGLFGRRATTGSGKVAILWEPLRVEESGPIHALQADPEPEPVSLSDAARFPNPEPYELPDLDATAHIAAQVFDAGPDRSGPDRFGPDSPGPSHAETDPQQGHPASRLSGLRSLLFGIDSLRARTATMTPPEEEPQAAAPAPERQPGDLRPIVNPFTENWSPFSDQMPSGISVRPEFSPLRPAETPDDLDRAARSNWIEIPSESDDPFNRL